MAGERDVLAEALTDAGVHEDSLPFPLSEFVEAVTDALAARGYTLSRSEPAEPVPYQYGGGLLHRSAPGTRTLPPEPREPDRPTPREGGT